MAVEATMIAEPDAPPTPLPPPPGQFEMVQRQPGSRLDGIVSRLTGYREVAAGHFRQVEAASLVAPLVINFGGSFGIGLGRAPGGNDRFGSFAAGLYAGPVVIDSFGTASCIQIDFTPLGARRFFRMPMTELTDRMVALDGVLGIEGLQLYERLANEPDWQRRLDLAERFVEERIAAAAAPRPEVAWAYGRILASGGRMPVSDIAGAIGWSRKHLAGRFTAETGLGPKTFARIVRFNRALRLAQTRNEEWAGIAAECGYSDQAHMAREFREMAGETPGSWQARIA
jgi:AraC-like DNA-binding protein